MSATLENEGRMVSAKPDLSNAAARRQPAFAERAEFNHPKEGGNDDA